MSPLHMQKVTLFMRLILPQDGACAYVIYTRITMVTVHVHEPPCCKISLVTFIANGRETSNFPVTAIPLFM